MVMVLNSMHSNSGKFVERRHVAVEPARVTTGTYAGNRLFVRVPVPAREWTRQGRTARKSMLSNPWARADSWCICGRGWSEVQCAYPETQRGWSPTEADPPACGFQNQAPVYTNTRDAGRPDLETTRSTKALHQAATVEAD